MQTTLQLSLSNDKKRKILQYNISRKRLSKANFHKEKIKFQNIDYLCCIPINGFSSDTIQEIRVLLRMYGYDVSQYTTKSFLSKLVTNNIKLTASELALFYLGQMLVLTVDLNKKQKSIKARQKVEIDFLRFISSCFVDVPFCSLIYISVTEKKINNETAVSSLVYNNVSSKFFDILPHYLNSYFIFNNFNSTLIALMQSLLVRIILLLSLLNFKTLQASRCALPNS